MVGPPRLPTIAGPSFLKRRSKPREKNRFGPVQQLAIPWAACSVQDSELRIALENSKKPGGPKKPQRVERFGLTIPPALLLRADEVIQ